MVRKSVITNGAWTPESVLRAARLSPMQVDIFTICDTATSDSRKLNIIGTFDTLSTASFPFTRDSFSVVAQVRFSPDDARSHSMDVRRVDLDGTVRDCSKQEDFRTHFSGGSSYTCTLIWNIRGKEFSQASESRFELLIDGRVLATHPFFIKEKKPG